MGRDRIRRERGILGSLGRGNLRWTSFLSVLQGLMMHLVLIDSWKIGRCHWTTSIYVPFLSEERRADPSIYLFPFVFFLAVRPNEPTILLPSLPVPYFPLPCLIGSEAVLDCNFWTCSKSHWFGRSYFPHLIWPSEGRFLLLDRNDRGPRASSYHRARRHWIIVRT